MLLEWLVDKLGTTLTGVVLGFVAFVLLCGGIIGAVTVLCPATPAYAYVGPRPTVELVKIFSCNLRTHYADYCSKSVEEQANTWLLEKQPGIRILQRAFAGNGDGLFLAISYEVSEWRTQQPKLTAEKP